MIKFICYLIEILIAVYFTGLVIACDLKWWFNIPILARILIFLTILCSAIGIYANDDQLK